MDFTSFLSGAGLFIIISAAVRSLPVPKTPVSGFGPQFYMWLYNFTHAVLSNYDKLIKKPNGGTNANT